MKWAYEISKENFCIKCFFIGGIKLKLYSMPFIADKIFKKIKMRQFFSDACGTAKLMISLLGVVKPIKLDSF